MRSQKYRKTVSGLGRILVVVFCIVICVAANVRPAKSAVTDALSDRQPDIQVRSLAMLMQIICQLTFYVKSKDLPLIHNEDLILSAAVGEILSRAEALVPNEGEKLRADLTKFSQQVGRLHLAGDLGQQKQAELELGRVGETFEHVKSHFNHQTIMEASRSLDIYCCPMHRDVVGKKGNFCPKCGMALDQMVRILPLESGYPIGAKPTVRASVRTAAPLSPGTPVSAILQLSKINGDPVLLSDLIETHTKKIHLLIIDESLADYHHEHPVATMNPGEYAFSFTPRRPGSYRVWADLRPYPLGLQEYAVTDIAAPTKGLPLLDRATNFKATIDGLNYELLLSQKMIRVGRPALATLRITTSDGKGFTQLEPIMATFAHIVGFNEDGETVLHMHPNGPPVLYENARGGPDLKFQIYALKAGFIRLFAQVQIGGISRFASFGIDVIR